MWWRVLRSAFADIRSGRVNDRWPPGKPVYRPRLWQVIGALIAWALIIWACWTLWPW